MINWNFPSNQDGQVKGVADAGIENFNGTELSSLARENCQNSLDAALDDNNPEVLVEFERYTVHDNQIPGIEEYRKILRKCKNFWDASKSEKAKTFLKNAVAQAERENGFVLRISDYNTTGLSDPYINQEDPFNFSFDGWNALVKIDGGANKGDDKAGAFGIGKSAPFSNSYYRLVFYRTYNQKLERAVQGISRLMSYREGTSMTSGVGYYGNPDGNNPVESIEELDALNTRTEIGTDVFIYGFKAESEWNLEITVALLESFLMSFYNGQLRVKVQDREINAVTLKSHMERIHNERPGATKGTYGNYLALTRKEGVYTYTKDFHGMGTLELRILVDPNEKLDRKVLIVRKAGMKLFRLGNISKLVPFTGILELKGKALNSYFRAMETVAHDNWEPGRHSDPKQAKVYYEEIKDWIRSIVAQLAEHTSDDEMDVEGLSGVLQREPEISETEDSDKKRENLNDHLGNIDIIERPIRTPSKGFFYGKGEEGSSESTNIRGTLGAVGEPGLRILKGKRKRKKLESHRGIPDPEGKDVVIQKKSGGESNCPLKDVRIIKRSIGTYSINFEIPHDVEYGRIELVAVGENGKSNRIHITDVELVNGCKTVELNGDFIEALKMSSSEKIKITVMLADSHDYAMEVNVYEHN
jgi:hypothetical protein